MSKRVLRIAMVGQQGIPARHGGVERAAEEVGARLVERGHEVTVFNSVRDKSPRIKSHRGIQLKYVPSTAGKYTGNLTLSMMGTARVLVGRYDIAHFHAIGPSIFTPMCRLRPGLGVVVTIHGRDDLRDKWGTVASKMLGVAAKISAREPDEVIVVSQALQRDFRDTFGRETIYIPNGVIAPPERPEIPVDVFDRFDIDPANFFLSVGRLVPEKAVSDAMRAFREVNTEATFVIVGGPSKAGTFEANLRTLAAGDPRVRLTGPLFGDDLDALYRTATAFVAPSHLEGLPLTVLEAASYGLPIICSNIAPHLEIMGREGDGRRLHGVGDEAGIAHKMRLVLDQTIIERNGAKELRDDVLDRFSWDDAADRTEDLYLRVHASR